MSATVLQTFYFYSNYERTSIADLVHILSLTNSPTKISTYPNSSKLISRLPTINQSKFIAFTLIKNTIR